MSSQLQATHLRGSMWIVRPVGCLGTCGWLNGKAWTARYISAPDEISAIRKARKVEAITPNWITEGK